MFTPGRRTTVLVPSGPANDHKRKHLFVLLTDTYGPAKQILMAPVCSVPATGTYDNSCLVASGDHPFLQHASYVAYDKCRVEQAVALENLVKSGYMIEKEPASEDLVASISAGLKKSKFARPFAKELLKEFENSQKPPK